MGRKQLKQTIEDDSVKSIKLPKYKIAVKCKNQKQKDFINSLKNREKEICFGIGSAGTGKNIFINCRIIIFVKRH